MRPEQREAEVAGATAAHEPRHAGAHLEVRAQLRLGRVHMRAVAALDDLVADAQAEGPMHLRCDEFCSSPDELSEARLRLYG